jgi:Zn-finger nucleic acid-binding protein
MPRAYVSAVRRVPSRCVSFGECQRRPSRGLYLNRLQTRTVEVMQCPNDQTVLQMTDRQGIEIDYCPTCRGVWLDRGELDKIIERASTSAPPSAPRSESQPDPRTEAAGYPAGYSQAPAAYPQSPAYGRSPKSPDSPDDYYGRGYDPRYQDPRYQDPRYHDKRKRKSFLGDLFDF